MDMTYYKKYEPIFGDWRIVREIGSGGFGTVFEIERKEFGYTYRAALKAVTIPQNQSELDSVLDDGVDEQTATEYFSTVVQEFVGEFRLMSKLKGESNIVSYEDHRVIKHEDGIGWDILIRMELLTPLLKYTKEHSLMQQDVIRLGIDICKALELCRRCDIIHRDIKPENIFVSESGKFKLGDFGIARTVEKTQSGLSKKGTYYYMAPEVYRGDEYGPSVDIYSLGLVLYRYLNNNRMPFLPPYPAAISHSDRASAISRRIKGEAIPAPANADKKLADIVLKACAYDPKQRYASASEMREALEALAAADAPVYSTAEPVREEATATATMGRTETLIFDATQPIEDEPTQADTVKKPAPKVAPKPKPKPEPKPSPSAPVGTKTKAAKKKIDPKKLIMAAVCLVLVVFAAMQYSYFGFAGNDDLAAIAAGDYYTIGLKSDGDVVARGDNSKGECKTGDWTDIIAISAGARHTVGLKPDGTVVAVGYNDEGQCNVGDWTDIIAVSAGPNHTVGLKSDGTAVAVGYNGDNYYGGQCYVSNWTDIVAVSAGGNHTVGVKSDGTAVAVGWNYHGQCDVDDWTDIIAVSANWNYTIGLRSDGTVVATGDNEYGKCDVGDWTDIIAISAGSGHTVGLKSDGTVVATGENGYGQCDVDDWTDIVAVSAGRHHTVGLKSDGTAVAVGLNNHGQCSLKWFG